MGWRWMKVFEHGNRTFMVGTSFDKSHGLTMQFMVRIGDHAQPCATLEHALMIFNGQEISNIKIAKNIPRNLNGQLGKKQGFR